MKYKANSKSGEESKSLFSTTREELLHRAHLAMQRAYNFAFDCEKQGDVPYLTGAFFKCASLIESAMDMEYKPKTESFHVDRETTLQTQQPGTTIIDKGKE